MMCFNYFIMIMSYLYVIRFGVRSLGWGSEPLWQMMVSMVDPILRNSSKKYCVTNFYDSKNEECLCKYNGKNIDP